MPLRAGYLIHGLVTCPSFSQRMSFVGFPHPRAQSVTKYRWRTTREAQWFAWLLRVVSTTSEHSPPAQYPMSAGLTIEHTHPYVVEAEFSGAVVGNRHLTGDPPAPLTSIPSCAASAITSCHVNGLSSLTTERPFPAVLTSRSKLISVKLGKKWDRMTILDS